MEWNIQKHWEQIVQKLVSFRKKQNVTQKRLAALTGVSTQTISRFEQAKEDLQLSTIFSILDAYGFKLELNYSFHFKFLIYKLLIDAIKENPNHIRDFLHNGNPSHSCYEKIAKGEKYPHTEEDNEEKNEIYQFLNSFSQELQRYELVKDNYPLISCWKDFCQLVFFSSPKGKAWLAKPC